MMRFFYRIFLVMILSCTLITQSFAQQAPPPVGVAGITESPSAPPSAANIASSWKAPVEPAPVTTVGGYKTSANMIDSVTMAGVGLVATRLYTYTMTTDMMLAAAGGAAFIYGELKTSKDVNDQAFQIATRADGTTDSAQMVAVEKMKATLVETRDGIKEKKKLQNLASLAFMAATAAALILKSSTTLAEQACDMATKTLGTTCNATVCPGTLQAPVSPSATVESTKAKVAQVAADAPAPSLSQCAQNVADTATGKASAAATDALASTTGSACSAQAAAICAASEGTNCGVVPTAAAGVAACAAAGVARTTACTAREAAHKTAYACGSMMIGSTSPIFNNLISPTVVVENKINPNFFEKLLGLVMPSAHASNMSLLFGVGGVAAGLMVSTSLGAMVDTVLFTPMKRAVVWGTLAFLTNQAAASSQDNIDTINGQIAKLDAIMNAMKSNGTGSSGTSSGSSATSSTATNSSSANSNNLNGSGENAYRITTPDGSNLPCATGSGNSNCASLNQAIQNSSGYKSLPVNLQGIAGQLGGFIDKVTGQRGVSADALLSAGSMAANIAPMQAMLGNAKSSLNAQLLKAGKPQLNLNKAQADLLKQLNKATESALQKAGMSVGGMMASMGKSGTGAGSGSGSAGTGEAKTSFAKAGANLGAAGAKGAFGKGSSLTPIKDDSKSGADAAAGVANAGNANDQYEVNNGDISTDSKTSIFTVISERYIKSAYPKLLVESPAPVKK
jgi:hypothetical protein